MSELHEALAEINAIRSQVARATQFRGYGPASVAASGVIALTVAALQAGEPPMGLERFVLRWTAIAALALAFAAIETVTRAKRVHSGLAREMLQAALEQFLPALLVGALLTGAVLRAAPHEGWMLPGLWQLFFSLGIFASCRFLPRAMYGAAAWYLATGLTCLLVGSGSHQLSPWSMGVPFGIGQCLVAAVLQFAPYEEG
ncbi:MAG TPA: hypothetical protein VKT22_08270 [Steroidobacteraceae bacterium]|nr:hypothetical protein [Steroidobacteraceae bacterium]